jgi:Mg-chelatase subunit ChlD
MENEAKELKLMWITKVKMISSAMLAAALAAALLATASLPLKARADAIDGCLNLTGTGSVSTTQLIQNDELVLSYTLNPSGNPTVTTQRAPVDVIFVADYSGSMREHINSKSSSPIRMDMLKTSSQTLTTKLQQANAGDKLGLIKFSTNASIVKNLTTSYWGVQTAINALTPYEYTNIDEALAKAKSMMSSQGTNTTQYIILLTDGKATRWTDNSNNVQSGDTRSASEAKKTADLIAPTNVKVYTIALAEPGSDEIDLNLLQYIADVTGGTMNQASTTEQLTGIFDKIIQTLNANAKLTAVKVRQPIPDGFILSPQGNSANIVYDPATKEAIIPVGDIPYPFSPASIPLELHLIPTTAAGEYPLQDAKVAYKNACNQDKQFPISFGSTLSVSVKLVDKYGNVYIGNTKGIVERFRASDKAKQWATYESNSSVIKLRFEDASDTVVLADYKDGAKSRLDLKPSAPQQFTTTDAAGAAFSDTNWHKGPGALTGLAGSAIQLPASTVYANDDFTTNYIAGYEYSIAGGEWRVHNGSETHPLPDGSGVYVAGRAYTNAISGSPAIPIGGIEASRAVSLDSTPPLIGWKKTIHYPSDDALIVITANENLSPVSSIQVWFDGSSAVSISANAAKITKQGDVYSYTFNLSDVIKDSTARAGWHQIVFGAESVGGPSVSAPDYFVVNPGPSAELGSDYEPGTDSDKPVTVRVENVWLPVPDKTFGGVLLEGYELKEMYYAIKTSNVQPDEKSAEWKRLTSYRLNLTTKPDESKGSYYVFLKLVDTSGVYFLSEPMEIKFDTEQKRY